MRNIFGFIAAEQVAFESHWGGGQNVSKVCLNHCQFEVWKHLCRGSEPKAATVADGSSGLCRDKLSCKKMLAFFNRYTYQSLHFFRACYIICAGVWSKK